MHHLVSMASCPNCGAPVSLDGDRPSVICIFCNTGLRVERPASVGAPAQLTSAAIAPEHVEQVKQLLIDGKRDEAVRYYANVASISEGEAEKAIDNVVLSAYWTLVRHLPMNAFGFVLHPFLISLGAAPAAWAATQVGEQPAFFALVLAGGLFALHRAYRFGQHLASTYTAAFGALGRARVLRCAVMRRFESQGGVLVVAALEVVPDDGSAPFVDQETLFIGIQALEKFATGNVIRVRFSGDRQHVFPTRPVTVLSSV